ncbi:DedA family protein [Aquaspirillum serpens]|uniref:DedA family protein n=1 Tax=Aquaspirillum serpens TaxID=190 RepID=UPI0003B68749|nr:DedA family protein [Aquaspirillum serpens]
MDILQLLTDFFTNYGYAAVFFVLLICGFGVPIPEDVTLVAGGIISGLGYTNVHTMFAVGMAGVLVGDATMFTIGRVYGTKVMQVRFVARYLTEERFMAVQEKFAKYGNWVLFVARFLPGLRSPIFLTAGMTRRVSFWRFLLMDGFAALISVPVWVYLGYFGANNRDWLLTWVHRGQSGILMVLAVAGIGLGVWWWLRRRKTAKSA